MIEQDKVAFFKYGEKEIEHRKRNTITFNQ